MGLMVVVNSFSTILLIYVIFSLFYTTGNLIKIQYIITI